MNADRLVVAARVKPQLDGRATHRHLKWQEVAPVDLLAVRGDCIDLVGFILAVDQAFPAATAAARANYNDVTSVNSPLALDSKKLWPEVENQVVSLVAEWLEHASAELERFKGNRLLSEDTFLIRRQHRQHRTRAIGRTVVRPGDMSF
jgi:hypothetical protein